MDWLSVDSRNALAQAGYVLVHEERGDLVQEGEVLPPGKSAVALNYMFVRADVLPLLNDQEKRDIDYSTMPLHKRWGYDWFMRYWGMR